MKKKFIIILVSAALLLTYGSFTLLLNTKTDNQRIFPPFVDIKSKWIDSAMQAMTLDEKIAQLIVYKTNNDSAYIQQIKATKPGSVIITAQNTLQLKEQVAKIRAIHKFPTSIGFENPWPEAGFADSLTVQINSLTLNAITNFEAIEILGQEIGRKHAENGIDFCFFPNLTSNFSENKQFAAIIKAYQQNQIVFAAKTSLQTASNCQSLINNGLGILSLASPSTSNLGPVLKNISDTLLFKGLTLTECNSANDSDIVKLLQNCFDLIQIEKDPEKIISAIKSAVNKGILKKEQIDSKCRRFLQMKYWSEKKKSTLKPNSALQLEFLKSKMAENSVTLLQNKFSILPLQKLDTIKPLIINIGKDESKTITQTANLFLETPLIEFEQTSDVTNEKISPYNCLILNVLNNQISYELINKIIAESTNNPKIILNLFGIPNNEILTIPNVTSILVNYDNSNAARNASIQAIFGANAITGKLPVPINNSLPKGFGIKTKALHRLKYGFPADVEANEAKLNKIDSVVKIAIKQKAFPGCQILAAKDGVVFYYKSFGAATYDVKKLNTNDQIYDLASITKIAATTTALMKLKDEGLFDENAKISAYLPELLKTNKKDMLCSKILIHQAKLPKWTPLFSVTMGKKSKNPARKELYSSTKSDFFSLEIADNIYINPGLKDSLMQKVYNCSLTKKEKYEYTDLGMFMFMKVIEKLSKQGLDTFMATNFYQKLGASTLGYKPLNLFAKDRLIPTEIEHGFRNQMLQGWVHDYAAALLGGVGGHAGLFGNANDLAKLMQMFLQKGEYGGEHFLNEKTIELFTRRTITQNKNRRGLGFDKPSETGGPSCKSASTASFGHTGFTGTIVWADPENNLIYVFLSNRVYPTSRNNKLSQMGIRSKIHQILYDALPKPTTNKKNNKELASKS